VPEIVSRRTQAAQLVELEIFLADVLALIGASLTHWVSRAVLSKAALMYHHL
jgi:hypothetical protein